ncbi:MAG: hypothetical protein PVF65_01905 [Sphingomonadales bacterium]
MLMRVTGIIFIALGLIALGVNLFMSLQAGSFTILSLGETWALLGPTTFQGLFGAETDPHAITGVSGFILGFPAFVPWLVIGLALILIKPKRKRKSIFR